MTSYRAVQADPTADRDTLLQLWSENLPVEGSVAAKHRWQYLDGPTGHAEAFVLHAGDGVVVGCAGVATRELWSRGRTLRAALFADFAVDRAHRTALPALVLQRAVKHHADDAFDLAYGMPNAKALAIYRRVGYVELGEMRRYVRVLRYGGYFERRALGHARLPSPLRGPAARVARAAGAIVGLPRGVLDVARASWTGTRSPLVWLPDFDSRFDDLWRVARDEFGIVSRRDSELLRWRFLRKPGEHDAIAALIDRASHRLRAYAIVSGGPSQPAEIRDAFGPLGALDDLLTLLAPALHARGHTAIGFRFLGDPRIVALLHAHQFSLREERRAVVASIGTHCAIDPVGVLDASAWYLTDLDEDT